MEVQRRQVNQVNNPQKYGFLRDFMLIYIIAGLALPLCAVIGLLTGLIYIQ